MRFASMERNSNLLTTFVINIHEYAGHIPGMIYGSITPSPRRWTKLTLYALTSTSCIPQDITSSLHKPQMKRRHKRKFSGPQHLAAHTKQGYSQTYQVKNNTTQQTQIDDNPDLWYLNPRFNFTDALADINKRLLSQTSFWIRL